MLEAEHSFADQAPAVALARPTSLLTAFTERKAFTGGGNRDGSAPTEAGRDCSVRLPYRVGPDVEGFMLPRSRKTRYFGFSCLAAGP